MYSPTKLLEINKLTEHLKYIIIDVNNFTLITQPKKILVILIILIKKGIQHKM